MAVRALLSWRAAGCVARLAAVLLFFLLPIAAGAEDGEGVGVRMAGPADVVFSWSTDRCEDNDIPDAPARAFRDAAGRVHLIASHFRNRALIGDGLDTVKPDCRVIFEANGADDPLRWDDRVWLGAFFTTDGTGVFALGHAEFHGHLRPALCPAGSYMACWQNAIIAARSTDGGASFRRAPDPGSVVAALPGPYDPGPGRPLGYFSPSNILKVGEFYYVFVFAAERGAQRRGACLLRSDSLEAPGRWRAWDGSAFTVALQPGATRDTPAQQAACAVIPGMPATVGSVSLLAGRELYVALIAARRKQAPDAEPIAGIYALSSPDLVHWSKPSLILAAPLMWARTCTDAAVVAYPSLLDAHSPSRNFETVSDRAFLYLTRITVQACRLTMARDLVRYPVEIVPPLGATGRRPR